MQRWIQPIAGLVLGGILGILARVRAEQAFGSGTMPVPGGGRTAADAIVERRRSRKVRAP
jgi:hypothetical protein